MSAETFPEAVPVLPPPLRRAHVQRAAELLAEIAQRRRPADQLLDALFRSHREMGRRDRATVSGLVYGVLRDVLRLRARLGQGAGGNGGLGGAAGAVGTSGASVADDESAHWLALHLADLGHSSAAIEAAGLPVPSAVVLRDPSADDGASPAHAALNLPADWHARLLAQLGTAEIRALAAALRLEAPVDLRINTLRGTREQAAARLAAEDGVAALPAPHSPWGLRLPRRLSQASRLLADGSAEPQDEGSQLLAALVAAQPGETVVDYCAGAGGKSLALAVAMQDRGRLVACDLSRERLNRLVPRAMRAGVRCIETRVLGGAPTRADTGADLLGRADAVLVDAPCSGSGTLRRNPELRLSPADVPALAAQQRDILATAARLVRPGGRLVYATCSLFADENEAVVADFLASHTDFARDTDVHRAVPLADAQGVLRLWPHRHGTDGFYAAALRRRA